MQNYLILLAASILLALDFAAQKTYQQKSGTGIVAGLSFNMIVGLATVIMFFALNGFKINITPYGLIISSLMSISVFIYTIIGFRILRDGNIALYSLFSLAGAIVVPYVFGIAFLDEKTTVFMLIGVFLIMIATVMSNISSQKSDLMQIILCISVFLLNGTGAVISKLCQVDYGYGIVEVNDFVCMTGITKFIICGITFLVYRKYKKHNDEKNIALSVVPWIILSAIVGGVSYMLQLIGAARLPASVLFPMVSGGSIIFSTLAGVIFFKEKPTKWQIVGICVCFAGTFMLL